MGFRDGFNTGCGVIAALVFVVVGLPIALCAGIMILGQGAEDLRNDARQQMQAEAADESTTEEETKTADPPTPEPLEHQSH